MFRAVTEWKVGKQNISNIPLSTGSPVNKYTPFNFLKETKKKK